MKNKILVAVMWSGFASLLFLATNANSASVDVKKSDACKKWERVHFTKGGKRMKVVIPQNVLGKQPRSCTQPFKIKVKHETRG